MNELALFAGAGGGILAGHMLGWRTVCAVEWNAYAASILCARQNDGFLPPFPIWNDVRTFDGRTWRGVVDVVSGGFPCQAFSTAARALTTRKTFGRKCGESWQMSLPGVSLPRTSRKEQSTTRQTTLNRWVTKPKRYPYPRETWVLTTFGRDFGFLHTPTATGNYCAPSMQKWPSARNYKRAFGVVTPESHEWLMGWPIGWTALQPLETGKSQSLQPMHGAA